MGRGPLAAAALAVLACSEDTTTPEPVVMSIAVEHSAIRILIGNQERLAAEAFDASGTPVADPRLSWETSDPGVATVDGTGLVQAVGPGVATVRALAGVGEDRVTVDVPDPIGTVGPAGASLSGAGGNVKLAIPPGALITERPISVVAALPGQLPEVPGSGDIVSGTAHEFGPTGLAFAEPVRLSVFYDPGLVPSGVFTDQLRIYRASESGWTEMTGSAIAKSGQEVSAFVTGFSVYAIGVASNRAPAAAFVVDCTGLDCDLMDQSSDPDGSIAVRSWDFGDGTTSAATSPSHSYGQAGEYEITLTVVDDAGTQAFTSRTVTVSLDEPVAAFAADCEDLGCTFTDQSVDGDGSVTTRAWQFGDGATSTEANPSHQYTDGGTYTVRLTVTDDDGLTDDAEQSVTVTNPPALLPPSADFSFECVELACQFTDRSIDSEGGVVAWAWTFGDGSESTIPSPSHDYLDDGTYSVSLEVRNSAGLFDTRTRSVEVSNPPGLPPSAAFSFQCDGVSCQFTDTSTDPDGDETIVSRTWDFGDGVASSDENPFHEYAAGGTYTVTLTVTDDDGAVAETDETLTITPYLVSGETVTGLSGGVGDELFFQIDVPPGQDLLRVRIESTMDPAFSDADLYLRFGSPPNTDMYDCRPFATGDNEVCNEDDPPAGTWFVLLFGVFGFEDVSLTATYSVTGTDLEPSRSDAR